MAGNQQAQTAEEWFAEVAPRYGITPDDLLHPTDLTTDEVEGLRAVWFDTYERQRGDFEVYEGALGQSVGGDELPYAYYAYKRGQEVGYPLGLDREEYEDYSRTMRFVPRDAEFTIPDKEAAVRLLRTLHSRESVDTERAAIIGRPWGIEDTLAEEWSDSDDISAYLLCKFIVGLGIDGEDSISASEYFGMSIGGHKKSDRGEYKGNLAIIEEDAGMEVTYGRTDPVQNPQDDDANGADA